MTLVIKLISLEKREDEKLSNYAHSLGKRPEEVLMEWVLDRVNKLPEEFNPRF